MEKGSSCVSLIAPMLKLMDKGFQALPPAPTFNTRTLNNRIKLYFKKRAKGDNRVYAEQQFQLLTNLLVNFFL